MTRIQPIHSVEIQKKDEEEFQEEKLCQRNESRFKSCISMRFIITLLIILLLTTCSVFVWLASFIGSITALQELSNSLVLRVGEKAVTYINSQLDPQVKLSANFAADLTNSSIPVKPTIQYLFQKYKTFKASSVGVFYSNELFSITVTGVYPNEVLAYSEIQNVGLVYWKLDTNNGNSLGVMKNTSNIPFSIKTQGFWPGSLSLFNSTGLETVIGAPYAVINSGVVIYCSTKVYDPVLFAQGTRKVIGMAKVNLTLKTVQDFLQQLTVIGNGYIVLAEMNDNVIGASINSTAIDGVSRISLFDLTDRNSGQLMRNLKATYGNMSNVPASCEISSEGVNYFISKVDYTYLNVHWILYMVVYKSDIERVTNINTGISVAVSVVVILFGICCSFYIGHMVTKPLRFLEAQFSKIKTFDLNSCNFISSQFKEVDRIYEHLYEMVTWLNEFKSFLPENVFTQLKTLQESTIPKPVEDTITQSTNSLSSSARGLKNSSAHQSGSYSSGITSGGLFKVGLSMSKVSVICIKLFGFVEENSTSEVSGMFSKLANALSSLAKTMKISDMKINNVDEFQLCFASDETKSEQLALEASIKIKKAIGNMSGKSGKKLNYSIGICSDLANIGNLGTSSLRYFSIVGSVADNAKTLALLGHSMGCLIVSDSNTLSNNKDRFIYKPIDRVEMHQHKGIQIVSIYEILRDNSVQQDEWLYELEQSNSNKKFSEIQSIFTALFETPNLESMTFDQLNDFKSRLRFFMQEHPQDSSNLENIVEFIDLALQCSSDSQSQEMIRNYKIILEKQLVRISKHNYSDELILNKQKI